MKLFVAVLPLLASTASGDLLGGGSHNHNHNQGNPFSTNVFLGGSLSNSRSGPPAVPVFKNAFIQDDAIVSLDARQGRQETVEVQGGGVDFSGCQNDPETGLCCVEKEETVISVQKDPILECTHKNVEKCHYTYVTLFEPAQEEVCEENFEKTCQITFKQQATEETVRKCYRPLEKVCNGQGPEECRTVYESSCTTKYIEKQPGKFVGDTACEKLPVEICGAGCVTEEGPEECHDKTITSLIDVPEEQCDLNPQKTCRFQTKLVPRLKPTHECTIIPRETCNLKFSNPEQVEKPLKTKWCLDPSAPEPDQTYDEEQAQAPAISVAAQSQALPTYAQAPSSLYSNPTFNY